MSNQTQLPPSKEALNFYQKAQDTVMNLYDRWQDEKKYEDIKDYQKPLDSIAKKTKVTILKMTKAPFGCHFTIEDGRVYALTLNSTSYQYKRIK